jgi:hypothetical protein
MDSSDDSTRQFKKEWGDFFQLETDTKKVHSRLGWIIGLSLLILTFIFFRIDYTTFMPAGRFAGPQMMQATQAGAGGAYGESTTTTIIKHKDCKFNGCVPVPGPGPDNCSSNSDCGMHAECHNVSGACWVTTPAGPDLCHNNSECGHKECHKYRRCWQKPGVGPDLCKEHSDCRGHSECINGLCKWLPGPTGKDDCIYQGIHGKDPKCEKKGCCIISDAAVPLFCFDGVSSFDCESNSDFHADTQCNALDACKDKTAGCCMPECLTSKQEDCAGNFVKNTVCKDVPECKKGCCVTLQGCVQSTKGDCLTWGDPSAGKNLPTFSEGVDCNTLNECKMGCCTIADFDDPLLGTVCISAIPTQCNALKQQDSGWSFNKNECSTLNCSQL